MSFSPVRHCCLLKIAPVLYEKAGTFVTRAQAKGRSPTQRIAVPTTERSPVGQPGCKNLMVETGHFP
jgi:hypothetical protein